MSLKNFLFLFDIDGTILNTHGDGKKAFYLALKDVFSKKITINIDFRGGIDRFFFDRIFHVYEKDKSEYQNYWHHFERKYIQYLSDYSQNHNWHIFSHARETIKYLVLNSNIALVTGNMKKGAEIKLQPFDLNQFFPTGGFGDQAHNREELVQIAIENSCKYYQRDFHRQNIFLLGDTLSDVTSAIYNQIIPVLIDHEEKNQHILQELDAIYYNCFKSFLYDLSILLSI